MNTYIKYEQNNYWSDYSKVMLLRKKSVLMANKKREKTN